jgi:hypothetical protein
MVKKLILFVFALAVLSCNNKKQEQQANTNLLYFDIKGYFEKEASRLKAINPTIIKQVGIGEASETKTTKINDWKNEFSIFEDADINKASWRGSFEIKKTAQTELYTSSNKKIKVKSVLVQREQNLIKKIEIIISIKNILYTSADTLSYYPDSLYEIKKQQKIKLLKIKRYRVSGKFKQ